MLKPKTPLIAIVGPTASGKTNLALSLAEAFKGEIVCADSRTVYRGLDIGTAKPTTAEQHRVPHHLLDVVDPGQTLSAAAFKRLAEAAIRNIAARGRIPFLVGGSGLYVDAVLFDYQFPPPADPARRAQLQAMTDQQLRHLLATSVDPETVATIDQANRRRLIRALETADQPRSHRSTIRPQTLVLGLTVNKDVMQNRIAQRIKRMLDQGFLSEVQRVGSAYGWGSEAMSGIGYRAFKDVVLGTKTIDQATTDLIRGDLALVKKQLTWFRRNPAIRWLASLADAAPLVHDFLAESEL